MVFSLFKYAKFIHHYDDHGKQNVDTTTPSHEKEENKES